MEKFRVYISTLNVILGISGYLFLSVIVGDRYQNVISLFFIFQLFLSVIVIFITPQKVSLRKPIIALFVFWILLILRFYYDMFVRDDIYIAPDTKATYIRTFIRILVPAISFLFSFRFINFEKVLKYSYLLLSIAVTVAFFSYDISFQDRLSVNSTIGIIQSGHFGIQTFILSLFLILKRSSNNPLILFFRLFIAIISLIFALKTGSRGPLFALIVVGFVWYYSRKDVSLFRIFIVVLLFFLAQDVIMNLLGQISPLLLRRFEEHSESGGQLYDRLDLYRYAWEAFLSNPIIGSSFGQYRSEWMGFFYWSHNSFLDALMQLGIIGGSLYAYILYKLFYVTNRLIKYNHTHFWLGLIGIQYIAKIMLSSAFYMEPIVTYLLVLCFLFYYNNIFDDSKKALRYGNDIRRYTNI